jgi:hypothetical protein
MLAASCFKLCTGLENVTFESNSKLTRIESKTFSKCSSLKSLQIPASVEQICGNGFNCCKSLISITFELNSHLTEIGSLAFRKCVSLQSICIPASVQVLSCFCFVGCDSLHELIFEPNSGLRDIAGQGDCDYWPIESMCIAAAFPINAKLWSALCRLLSRCFVQISKSSLKLFRGFAGIWFVVLGLSNTLISLNKSCLLWSLLSSIFLNLFTTVPFPNNHIHRKSPKASHSSPPLRFDSIYHQWLVLSPS